jgi:hypothetical protein
MSRRIAAVTSAWRAGGSHTSVATKRNSPTAASLNVNVAIPPLSVPPSAPDLAQGPTACPRPSLDRRTAVAMPQPHRAEHATMATIHRAITISTPFLADSQAPGGSDGSPTWLSHEVAAVLPGCVRPYGPTRLSGVEHRLLRDGSFLRPLSVYQRSAAR